MGDYGHDLRFGAFVTPGSDRPEVAVALAQLAEGAGLDLVTFQDHPYQPAFLDTWTLLSFVAARTSVISLAPNVINLPLRQPAVLARSAASLDRLSGGRIELGLGAGGFWDAIEAMGGWRLSPGQSVQALGEAIGIIRGIWATGERGVLNVDGEFHRVHGAKRGPAPAHDIGIWLGAYKPRMLRLIGESADGWLPSLGYIQLDQLAEGNRIIDDAATQAGRQPADVRRLLNLNAEFEAEQLAEIALADGISTFILGSDDPSALERFGREIAPSVRELVEAARAGSASPSADAGLADLSGDASAAVAPTADADSDYDRLGVTPTATPQRRLSETSAWDESDRPRRASSGPSVTYTDDGRAVGQHLIDVHDHLREELTRVRTLIDQVQDGALDPAAARSVINEMTLRQNEWTVGAYCASYCRIVTQHHSLEDASIFPHLRAQDRGLEPVIDRLAEEHEIIHAVLDGVDRALVHLVANPQDFSELRAAVDLLTDALLSHLAYEEQQLVEPLARVGFYPGQLN